MLASLAVWELFRTVNSRRLRQNLTEIPLQDRCVILLKQNKIYSYAVIWTSKRLHHNLTMPASFQRNVPVRPSSSGAAERFVKQPTDWWLDVSFVCTSGPAPEHGSKQWIMPGLFRFHSGIRFDLTHRPASSAVAVSFSPAKLERAVGRDVRETSAGMGGEAGIKCFFFSWDYKLRYKSEALSRAWWSGHVSCIQRDLFGTAVFVQFRAIRVGVFRTTAASPRELFVLDNFP